MPSVFIHWGGSSVLIDTNIAKAVFECICLDYGFKPKELVVNVVDTGKIVEINQKHLNHDYPTDIITFNYNRAGRIAGELYLCRPFIEASAEELGHPINEEFLRVYIHGILHLVGEDDHTKAEVLKMRAKENHYLNIFYK